MSVKEPSNRRKALKLFTYLSELAQLSASTVRDCAKYVEVIWLDDIPHTSDVRRMAWRDEDAEKQPGLWIQIKKPELKEPPKLSADLRPWIDESELGNPELETPSIRQTIRKGRGREPGESLNLDDYPAIRMSLLQYIDDRWKKWAQEERLRRSVMKIYERIFSLFQKQQQEPEAYELIVGMGLLRWQPQNGHAIRRHIIAAQTNLTLDSDRGIISVSAAGEGAKLALEHDMLDEPPDLAGELLEAKIEEIGDAVWDRAQVSEVLRRWLNRLAATGRYSEEMRAPENITPYPTIHLAPALILRKRREKGYVAILKEILSDIQKSEEIAESVETFLNVETEASTSRQDLAGSPEEIYFPKPTNAAQEKIVRKLMSQPGLVVEGPPGTGKSHTIANLICHLLATEKRVLVTSHSPRALRVLRDQLPKKIAPLCILLLDDDRAALKQLEDSVSRITTEIDTWKPEENEETVGRLERKLDQVRREESKTLRKLVDLRDAEKVSHEKRFGTYRGKLADIAKQVNQGHREHLWLTDKPKEEDEPPLTNEQAVLLLSLLREKHRLKSELEKSIPSPHELLKPKTFMENARLEELALAQIELTSPHRSHSSYIALLSVPCEELDRLQEDITQLKLEIHGLRHRQARWVASAVKEVLSNQSSAWQERLGVTENHLERIQAKVASVAEKQVTGLRTVDRDPAKARSVVKAAALALLQHLESGGKLRYLWFFTPKPVRKAKPALDDVHIDDRSCDHESALRDLLDWISVNDTIEIVKRYWSDCLPLPTGASNIIVSNYRSRCDLLREVLGLTDKVRRIEEEISRVTGLDRPPWDNADELERLIGAIDAAKAQANLSVCKQEFEGLERHLQQVVLSPNPHPKSRELLSAVTNRDCGRYIENREYLLGLWQARDRMKEATELLRPLKESAPQLVEDLLTDIGSIAWDGRMSHFTESWNWARCNGWLRRLADHEAEQALSEELEGFGKKRMKLVEDLVAAKAWQFCLGTMSPEQLAHLKGWKQEINLVGKGTGKFAQQHRENARKHLTKCRSAIPAWIMPIYRVAQTVTPSAGLFDFVIVDEASQAGPEAMFLLYIAKKLVVVGDDKQIAPTPFIRRDLVQRLINNYIPDLEHNQAFGVDYSFFDTATRFYPAKIRLTEHFRCMPEIIQFSNNLFYSDAPLIPLRPRGLGRLDPLKLVEVVDGYQKGEKNVINEPEALQLVDDLEKCINDETYEGKTIGVISLLGRAQAQYIEQLLRNRIGTTEMAKRRLVCGEAYAFQGDERDVIFLSMVRSQPKDKTIQPLTLPQFERRFNVAASRARDQMWLFHSLSLNNLSKECLRYKLIKYFQNPGLKTPLDPEKVYEDCQEKRRSRSSVPEPFDSWFEIDVFLKIVARGYRVQPQFQVGGYFVDLAVFGMQGCLAVECDGDSFHGPERSDPDMARQRDLERCGWPVWRIRASAFYRDPDLALNDLWELLDRMKIHP